VTGTAAITNTATKTAEVQVDPVSGNNSASAGVNPVAADIAITKTVDNATPNLGNDVTYTITATNNGPSNATGVQVTDLVPAGLTFVLAVASAGAYDSATGVWTIGPLTNGTSATLSLVATTTGTATVTNTATKTAADQVDPLSGNNSATATVTGQAADIGITKTVDNASPNLGSNVTFTITATNHGPSNATAVQVTDLLPAGLTFVSANPSSGSYDSATGVWTIGPLANASNVTLSITATVTTVIAVVNTATKTAEFQTDTVPANNSATATVTGQAADIAITKSVDNATPNLGSNVIFTVSATNNGPSPATGVQVTDLLPAGLTYVSSTASGATTYNSGTGVWAIGMLGSGANATLAISATVTTTAAATNTATKSAENQTDLVPGNDTATATVTGQAADIAVTKGVDNSLPNLNTSVTFTITVTNRGPSGATGVVVNDPLPAGLLFVSATPSGTTTYDSATGAWTVGALANGANQVLVIVATVTTTSPVTNVATKTAELQPDAVAGNDAASVTVTGQAADIAIAKSVSNATPDLGAQVTFLITASNNGPSTATGVQVTEFLPAGLTFVSATASGTTTYNSGSGLWDIGALGNGAVASLSVVATVSTTAPTTNTATRTAADQPDTVVGNNSATATVTPVAADIAIAKSVDNPTPNLGSNVTFTIRAINNGPSNATGVVVSDLLPAGFAFVSAVASAGSYDATTGVWTVGAIADGATATLTIVARVISLTNLANQTNIATKTAEDQVDPVSSNNSASSTVACCLADVAVTKTVDNPTPNLGSNVIFAITATNNGPANASGLQLTDQLPSGLIYVASTPGVGTYNSISGVWAIGALANGSTVTLQITATVNTLAATTNTASKTAENEADNTAGDDTASAAVTPIAADIAITKTVSNSMPNQGSNVTFTITARNNGPSNATGVLVSDLLPAGLTYVSSAPSGITTYNSLTGLWTVGPLGNAVSATLVIVARVTGTSAVTNSATKTAELQPDAVSGNDTASATVTGQAADIAILKTLSNPTPNVGSTVAFVVTATNNGPSNATGVEVTDSLPAGLTLVSATPSAGTYNSGTGIWQIGPLVNGAFATLSIVATVNTTTAITNTATKTAGNQPDSVPANDSSLATVSGQAVDIAVTKTVDLAAPTVGQDVTYTLVTHNFGPSTAIGVQLLDTLPADVTFVSYTATQGTYNWGTGVWNLGTMANASTQSLAIIATIGAPGPILNTAVVLGGGYFDTNLSNNSSTASLVARIPALPGVPGLPNTSAPNMSAGAPGPGVPDMARGLAMAILAVAAALAVLVMTGFGRRPNQALLGRRRSRSGVRKAPGRLTAGLLAVVLSLSVSWFALGGELSSRSAAAVGSATQVIGSKVVAVAPPAAPQEDIVRRAVGAINPAHLVIPSIGVDARIGAVGLRADGSMDSPDNLWTSSWLATGPRPGQAGNAVIAGHRGIGTPALFSHLEKVRPGDRIYVSDGAGNELVYVVTRIASMDLSNATSVAVFAPTPTQQLVLVTCFGAYVASARTYDHRLVVFSTPLPMSS
jgi:LPXTG-site transpeptidase (sortase) family protein